MKKLVLTIAIVLGLSMASFAQGGLFQRGNTPQGQNSNREGGLTTPGLPGHGESGDQPAPLGSGIIVFTALGAAYGIAKKHREE